MTENKHNTTDNRPVYILGGNALACYLGATLTNAGERVILLTDDVKKNKLNSQGITLKEGLRKKHYTFETAVWTKEEPKLLIITSDISTLHSDLSALTPSKICNAPVICFTLLKDTAYLRDILGCNFTKAVFDGWLLQNNQHIALADTTPAVTVYTPLNEKSAAVLEECFIQTPLKLTFSENECQTFWSHFTVYAAASLVTAAYNQNLAQAVKNSNAAYSLNMIAEELCRLAEADKITLSPEDMLKRLYDIPADYIFPLQTEAPNGNAGELDTVSSVIRQASRRLNLKTPETNNLIHHIYGIYLSIT